MEADDDDDDNADTCGLRILGILVSARVGLKRRAGGDRRRSPLVDRPIYDYIYWPAPIQPLLACPDSLVTPRLARSGDGNERRMQCRKRKRKRGEGGMGG